MHYCRALDVFVTHGLQFSCSIPDVMSHSAPNWILPFSPTLQTFEFVLVWVLPEVWEREQRPLFETTRSNGGQANRRSKHVFPGTEEERLPLISTLLWTGWWTAARCFGSVFTLPQGYYSGREFYILSVSKILVLMIVFFSKDRTKMSQTNFKSIVLTYLLNMDDVTGVVSWAISWGKSELTHGC